MTATNYTLECEQGATFRCVVTWKNDQGEEINNTGASGLMQVRKEAGSDIIIIELDSDGNGIELCGSDGKINISINASDTAALEAGDYFYDLKITAVDGIVSRLMEGVFSVKREITI